MLPIGAIANLNVKPDSIRVVLCLTVFSGVVQIPLSRLTLNPSVTRSGRSACLSSNLMLLARKALKELSLGMHHLRRLVFTSY